MNLDDLTLKQIREIKSLACAPKKAGAERDFEVGETVLIRTVTFYWVGTVTKVTPRFVTLSPAACIYDTGRFHDALVKGTLSEIEPSPKPVRVGIGAIVDVEQWDHPVPMTQK